MSKIQTLEVPKWGLSMEEGMLSQWLIAQGARFNKGQEICEIETSKITNVLEAPFDGVLRRLLAQPGDTLPVGAALALCAEPEVTDAELDSYAAGLGKSEPAGAASESTAAVPSASPPAPAVTPALAAAPAAPAASGQRQPTRVPDSLRGDADYDRIDATSHARRLARRLGIDPGKVSGSGRGGRISVADIERAIVAAGGHVEPPARACAAGRPLRSLGDDGAVPATPLARRLAARLGINLLDCRRVGRVSRADVEAAAARFSAPTAQPVPTETPPAPEFVSEPLSMMRRTIASRLQTSKRNAPHFRLVVDLDLEPLLTLRQEINHGIAGVKVTVNDLLVKAAAQSLIAVPAMNVQYDEESHTLRRFSEADVAVAVALPSGLFTPILHAANRKTIGEISQQLHQLFTRTKAGTLRPEEFQGGTFCLSNLGMFGVRQFDAIINPPQCAILAVGAGELRPVARDGAIVARQTLTVSLSCDHRVIDGAVGATFLQELKRRVETPSLMLA
ncbi:2-oxo acid dehydrogenase subunit E2 [Affinibrenneria salicis]|uniref:Dihydrolipoamide acetyltransferase component of pyruvate dehydrogenase complex n=1 Tax=Affinibrenneria salicis TaxID=2590031 RepID=A0A5J5FSX5_9GAMM|nr:2-oxo acid dehydrogenase subunit E2 [Affinibrenneria salicis]KAA8996630.1 2-oxo acid dehydrogenase subunit E2 [Affinibrenneria salicis]